MSSKFNIAIYVHAYSSSISNLLCEAHVAKALGTSIVLFPNNCDILDFTPLCKLIANIIFCSCLWNHNEQSYIFFLLVFRFVRTLITTVK